jgi:hypothetical protein
VICQVFFGGDDLQLHDRFEEDRAGLMDGLAEASEAAKRKASSLLSTSWASPSIRVTLRSTRDSRSGRPIWLLAEPGLDGGDVLGGDDAALELC